MKIIVVGAGIVGVSVAYRLAEAGAEVICTDPLGIAGGTSAVSYGWVNACEKLASRSYYLLNMAGRKAHERLVEELDGADWYPRPGIVQWQEASAEAVGFETPPQQVKYRRLVNWGYPVELVDGDELMRLEPDISADAIDGQPIIIYPEDGWCYAVIYSGRLAGAATKRYGARFLRSRVRRVDIHSGKCRGVVLCDGTSIGADAVVNCAGRWFNDIIEDRELRVPLTPTAGFIAYTTPVGLQLRRGLRTPRVNLRQDGGGRIMLRGFDIDQLAEGEMSPEVAARHGKELLDRARAVLSALKTAKIEATRIAIRPCPADSYSAVGPIPDVIGLYAAVTHSGVTLAPVLGEAVTHDLMGTPRPDLLEFRVSRFFRGSR